MRPVAPFLALLLVPVSVLGQELTAYEAFDRFRLFTGCSPIRIFAVVEDDENDLGLSEERVETAERSRLRGARIFYSGPTHEALMAVSEDDRDMIWGLRNLRLSRSPVLSVYVHVVGRAFSLDIEMEQAVYTAYTDLRGTASTWSTGTTGTHGQDPSFVLGAVAEHMDSFIDDYLRVNEEACSN